MNYVTLRVAFYFSPVYALFSLDNFHFQLISTKSVVSLVFTSALLPELVTPKIVGSFLFHVALSSLLLLYLHLDIRISYLFSVESRLHIYTSKYFSIRELDKTCIHVVCLFSLYRSASLKPQLWSAPSIFSTTKHLTGVQPGKNVAMKRIVHLSLWKPKKNGTLSII